MRVPCIFRWPSRIAPGATVAEIGCTLDLFTTVLALAGGELPADRAIDGLDLSPVLFGTGASPRNHVFFYRGRDVHAVRLGAFKAHFLTRPAYGRGAAEPVRHEPPLLYNLEHDPGEQLDVAQRHPRELAAIRALLARHRERLVPGPPQLRGRLSR